MASTSFSLAPRALAQPHGGRSSSSSGARRGVRLSSSVTWTAPKIWTPRSERSDLSKLVVAQQGPAPPNPIVVERFQQVVSQLFTQRIVRLGGPVDDDMANLVVAQLLYLDAAGKSDISMYVNSPGGSVTAGMAVFDTMRFIRPDVSTVCVGLAASMGAFLLASGAQGKRYSLPNSRIMIHQPLGGAQGQAADIEIQANEILHHKLTLNGYLAEFSGQSLERITADTDRDFFMSAEEAVDYGLVDAVVSRPYFSSDIPFSAKQAARSAAVVGGDESEAKKAPGNRAARVLLPKALGGDRVLAFAVTERAKELGLEASADAIKKAEKELPTFAPIIQRTVGDIAQYTGRISGNRRAADAAADAAIKAFSEMDELKDGQEPTDKKVASPAIALGIKAMNESLVEQGGRAILRPQDIVKEDPEVKMKRNEFLKKRAESMRAGRE